MCICNVHAVHLYIGTYTPVVVETRLVFLLHYPSTLLNLPRWYHCGVGLMSGSPSKFPLCLKAAQYKHVHTCAYSNCMPKSTYVQCTMCTMHTKTSMQRALHGLQAQHLEYGVLLLALHSALFVFRSSAQQLLLQLLWMCHQALNARSVVQLLNSMYNAITCTYLIQHTHASTQKDAMSVRSYTYIHWLTSAVSASVLFLLLLTFPESSWIIWHFLVFSASDLAWHRV